MEFRKINSPPALRLRPVERHRFWHTAHVDVFQVAVLADEIEDDASGPRIAKRLQLCVLGVACRFIEDRVEQKLALLKATAGQPLDLHKELRAEAAQDARSAFRCFEEQR